jgi:hypothetical protein
MRIFGLCFIMMVIIFNVMTYGQEGKQINKEIGLSFFSLEINTVTLNIGIEPKFMYGVYFNKYISKLSWISNIEFGKNTIKDEPHDAEDAFYGDGKMTELLISTGIRYTFSKQKSALIKPFLESDIYYSYLIYKGEFSGGYSGNGTIIDNSYNTFGILGRAGLLCNPVSKISLTISSSFRIGTGTNKDHYNNSTENDVILTLTILNLRLGYFF